MTKNIAIYPSLVKLVCNQKMARFASFFWHIPYRKNGTKTQHDLAIIDYQYHLKQFTIIKQVLVKPE